MALKVELKPHERIIIGNCVITNTDQRARLLIDGDKIPILREKDILTPETADTPAKLDLSGGAADVYFAGPEVNHATYFSLLREIVTAAPSAWPIIEGINNNILSGDLYQALKEARKLIAYEKKLLDHSQAVQNRQSAALTAERSHRQRRRRLDIRHGRAVATTRCPPNSSTAEISASMSQMSVR